MGHDPAYGAGHRRARKVLLATTPGGTLCPFAGTDPKCPGAMWPGAELLDAHHLPGDKAAGKLPSTLAHRACNRREKNRKIAADKAARRDRLAAAELARLPQVLPGPGCGHGFPLDRQQWPGPGCECADPAGHMDAMAAAWRAGEDVAEVWHYPAPCAGCGGYWRSRKW